MRIAAQGQSLETLTTISSNTKIENAPETVTAQSASQLVVEKATAVGEEQEILKEKLQQAVQAVNDFLEINHSSSKFKYHEGLERYYVTLVNRDTEEVVKEIPPKKLLDAFYEMQKLLGVIVDEKI